ncbi:DUF397 domain-containing protein [Streptomyces sp. NPDC051162]|uniref:DUF397 domain-containing protein n=1 Tax=unclassified Streptomyces TaxID=2593676 RepID=UPI00343C0E22
MSDAMLWLKSSYSDHESECVEVAACPRTVHVRDSKRIPGPHLVVTAPAWADFVAYASADAREAGRRKL